MEIAGKVVGVVKWGLDFVKGFEDLRLVMLALRLEMQTNVMTEFHENR